MHQNRLTRDIKKDGYIGMLGYTHKCAYMVVRSDRKKGSVFPHDVYVCVYYSTAVAQNLQQ